MSNIRMVLGKYISAYNNGKKPLRTQKVASDLKEDYSKSFEIERATKLRQPELSFAMKHLRRKGLITKKEIRKGGKGRPLHLYKLKKPFSEIIKNIEKEERMKISKIEENLKEIKKYV